MSQLAILGMILVSSCFLVIHVDAGGSNKNNNDQPMIMTMDAPRMEKAPEIRDGGPTAERDGDAFAQKAVDATAQDIKKKANLPNNAKLTAVRYTTAVVSGTSYYIKVKVETGSGTKYIHVNIIKGIGKNAKYELFGVQNNKKLTDPITTF